MTIDFVACGNLTIDDVVSVDGTVAANQCGGNGLYAALGIWLWGERVGLVAGAGQDYPREWLSRLHAAGVDTTGVYNVDEPHALRSRVFYQLDGSRTDRLANVSLGEVARNSIDLTSDFSAMGSAEHQRAWPMYSPSASQLPTAWRSAAGFHLAPGPHGNLLDLVTALRASAPDALLTLDWPWWNAEEDGLATDLLKAVTAVLPGAEEIDAWPVAGSPEATTRALVDACPVVVVKRGGLGSDVYQAGPPTHVGVSATTVIDPTGAGDAFCGGFLVGLSRTRDPVAAAHYGAVSASFVIETFGALGVLDVDRDTVGQRLDELQSQQSDEGVTV